ncbi:MAG: amidohydrolase family protein [Gemmataceae bacterium]|nr:amidohydrolase family protein [Gemmataceae bacterium]
MDLWHIPAIDQHAHPVLKPDATMPFAAAFTEGHDPILVERFARQTLFYRRSLHDLAMLLECDATEEAIVARRGELGPETLTERCLGAARLETMLLDDGYLAEQSQPLAWHRRFVPVRRLLRLETLAEDLLATSERFQDFDDRLRAALDPPPADVVAFKSIAAYRCGLRDAVTASTEHVECWFNRIPRQNRLRLTDAGVIHHVLRHALEAAARHGLPIQFHAGFGDADLDLRDANPLHLRPLLELPACRQVPIVLLHNYPFVREAGYLASVYPRVYADFGLAVPFLSVGGMKSVVAQLLELAPTGKVLYSSDAHFIPELFYLGAKWGRLILGETLENAVDDGDLTAREADQVAAAILCDNARVLYRL